MFPFGLYQIFFTLVFVLIIGVIIVRLVQSARTTHKNNQSPRVTASARVVSKRVQVGSNVHGSANGMAHNYHYSKYFATFEFESGDRLELPVTGQEYGLLVEGDRGQLTFQGTRYLGFARG